LSEDVKFIVPLATITSSGLWSSFESTRMSASQLLHNSQRLNQFKAAVNEASSDLLKSELKKAQPSLKPALNRLNTAMENLELAAADVVQDARLVRVGSLIGWSTASEVFVDAMLEAMVALIGVKVKQEDVQKETKTQSESAGARADEAGQTVPGAADDGGAVFAAASLKLANALSDLTRKVLLSAVCGMQLGSAREQMQREALSSLGMAMLMFALQGIVFPDHMQQLARPGAEGAHTTAPTPTPAQPGPAVDGLAPAPATRPGAHSFAGDAASPAAVVPGETGAPGPAA